MSTQKDTDCEAGSKLLRFLNSSEVSAEDIDRAFGTATGTFSLGTQILAARSRLIDASGRGFANLSELDNPEVIGDTRLGSILDAVAAGALEKLEPVCPALTTGSNLPSFIVVTGRVPGIFVEFLPWLAQAPPCRITKVTRTETYSRGNNDQAEMATQKAKTGLTQYNTGTFDLQFVADPLCICVQGKCTGAITLTLSMKITLAGRADPLDYMLVPGPDPSVPTTPIAGRAAPGPDVTVQIDEIDIPKPVAGNVFVQPAAGKSEFTANASHTVPCDPGKYSKRFYIFPKDSAGEQNVTPGQGTALLVFIIDVNVTVAKTSNCTQTISLETFMMEFRLAYDFTHGGALPGADAELPEVRPKVPGAGGGGLNNTRNIAKRISVNGTPTDTAFPPKAP